MFYNCHLLYIVCILFCTFYADNTHDTGEKNTMFFSFLMMVLSFIVNISQDNDSRYIPNDQVRVVHMPDLTGQSPH